MKYKIILTDEAKKDFSKLDKASQKKLDKDYEQIREHGTDSAYIKYLEGQLFEIRTNDLRSLFTYREGQIIIVAVIFRKKTQKTPESYKTRAKNILKNIGEKYYD
jgi:phage-related protein